MDALREAGVGTSCELASTPHGRKASMVQDPKISGHYFIFQHRAGWNVDSVSVVRYDDDGSLADKVHFRDESTSYLTYLT